jgi:hypothetical protein
VNAGVRVRECLFRRTTNILVETHSWASEGGVECPGSLKYGFGRCSDTVVRRMWRNVHIGQNKWYVGRAVLSSVRKCFQTTGPLANGIENYVSDFEQRRLDVRYANTLQTESNSGHGASTSFLNLELSPSWREPHLHNNSILVYLNLEAHKIPYVDI